MGFRYSRPTRRAYGYRGDYGFRPIAQFTYEDATVAATSPSSGGVSPPPPPDPGGTPSTLALLTEAGNPILTETSNAILTETS